MENVVAVLVIVMVLALLAIGQHVGFAMVTVGIIGICSLLGFGKGLLVIEHILWDAPNVMALIAMPLFILMSELLLNTGISSGLYKSMAYWLGAIPGGLLHSNIGSCTIFAAISGSSPATTATIGTVAIPELEKQGYDSRLTLGSITAGGTLGLLIPPSITLIIYGAMVGESVGRLFIAGIIPGIILAVLFMGYIFVRAILNPKVAPRPPKTSWKEKFISLGALGPVALLILAVLGSIYLGVATPTEAAALGVGMACILGLAKRTLTWTAVKRSLINALRINTAIMIIYVGASCIAMILGYAGVPHKVANAAITAPVSPYIVLLFIYAIYLILGCFFDPMSILVLTLPILYPAIMALGFDSIWYGVVVVMLIDAGMITPPVGLNLYIMQSIAPKYPFDEIVRGVMPFFFLLLLALGLLTAFPALATWLPSQMMGT